MQPRFECVLQILNALERRMHTESDNVDAGRIFDAAAMLGIAISGDMRERIGIDIQSAFNAVVPVVCRVYVEDRLLHSAGNADRTIGPIVKCF